jgi:hypothetical protein
MSAAAKKPKRLLHIFSRKSDPEGGIPGPSISRNAATAYTNQQTACTFQNNSRSRGS